MVLPGSYPPCPNPGPARVYRTRAGGAPAGGGHRVRARTTLLTPRTPEEPRPPRAARAGSSQPGVRRSPGPRPRAAVGSAAELGHRPFARLAWPRRTLQGKSPQRPTLAPQESTESERKARGSGRPGLDPNLPGAASAAAAAGGRAVAAAAAAGQARLGPGRAQRGRRERLRFGSCSAPTGAGVTALRRRCSLAPPPGRCLLAARSPALPGARRRSLF